MSFSSEIKQELSGQTGKSRHCQLAELAAIISHAARIVPAADASDKMRLILDTENDILKKKYVNLLGMLFDLDGTDGRLEGEEMLRVLESIKVWNQREHCFHDITVVDGLLVQQTCCKRAFIRGAFLAAGSMSDPSKAYHLEVVCRTLPQARQLQDIMNDFEVDAKIVERKKHQVVYIKEGEHIVDLLNVMEAHVALMNLENVRIMKEMRNDVNRKVNCETANITKTVSAAVRQREDIQWIRDNMGLESLPEHLQDIALLRLQYPEAPLKELGTYLDPPVGKSGVNHRLRRISEIAETMREKGSEYP